MNQQKKVAGKCISVLGTGSDVGKSIVATAICRILKNKGYNISPYKAQNMSNNSAVTEDGGEMGRAQVVQAQASKIEPTVDMNPVLLKPCSDTGSQVVLCGTVIGNKEAGDYFKDTDFLFKEAQKSLLSLRNKYDIVVMEGAGSCAEVNLFDSDFVNFKTALQADAPVILVADIDRGGVFAQIIGSLAVIPEKHKNLVKGIIVNRFRGDPKLFEKGIEYLEQETKIPVLGLIPYYQDIQIDSEDGLQLNQFTDPNEVIDKNKINVAVIKLPHISNFTDFAPLEYDGGIQIHYLSQLRNLDNYQLVILPGSKNVRGDIKWLNSSGWAGEIKKYAKGKGQIGGICGGYQMLGSVVKDPHGVEGEPGDMEALDVFQAETTLLADKTLNRSEGVWLDLNQTVSGYEIHMGETVIKESFKPAIQFKNSDKTDGIYLENGKVWGTYFHGLFNDSGFFETFFKKIDPSFKSHLGEGTIHQFRSSQYDLLAEHFSNYMDVDRMMKIIDEGL
ncbi:MAG: cobyric acid synthase [Deltaproteobacteria bacterium]|jgi:adenosylcobyric acid synthase|nr:cobyric acid synthase [Deltaproteobacteria bacterium]MBT4527935.1 cobyric acid synthase [Deltaproteobacteria bacterium]